MVKIMKERWGKNQDKLRAVLAERTDLNSCIYEDLVKLTFETIFNVEEDWDYNKLDLGHITAIDNGSYQGTLLFVIPFNTFQPCESEYIMTYIGYGSCSYCDTLQHAQSWHDDGELLDENQISSFMSICKDLVCSAIKPYNYGWRHDGEWEPAEVDEV